MNPLRRIRPEDTYRQLDSIAEKVACELLRRHGDTHGSPPECSRLESEGDDHAALVKVLEMKLPTMLVLDGMNTVLYDQLGFKPGSLQRYYDLENSYIDKVLVEAGNFYYNTHAHTRRFLSVRLVYPLP